MKLGVFSILYQDKPFHELLDVAAAKGLHAVELGSGNYVGKHHCDTELLLRDNGELRSFRKQLADRGLFVSALSCHGNPLHPQQPVARGFHETLLRTIDLAERLEVPVVNTLSGCPGDHDGALYPNWPASPWPPEYPELLQWQWERKVIPYWTEVGAYAEQRGVRIGIEMHGGFSVHSPATLMRLREAASSSIGANFDPSHLWWQGIDPIESIHLLGEAGMIYHVHAKDTMMVKRNLDRHGVIDMQSYGDPGKRAWQFRTVGYGHDAKVWADIISALQAVGYDYVVSIEHEDGLMSIDEGFDKAVEFLRSRLIADPPAKVWWA